ncbi:MAG: hypothetical protein Q4C22_03300 [Bacillota bacterium]|nr:hypothetical protein [Bacillota bacterium]
MKKQEIVELVKKETAESALNHLGKLGRPEEKLWGEPELGFAAGDDPLFRAFKEDNGSFYWTPKEAFLRHYEDASVREEELTVLSVVFPQNEETKALQRKQKTEPGLPWMYSRNSWGPFIQELSLTLKEAFAARGLRAAALDLPPGIPVKRSERYGPCAAWSHRHAAHAAGLGTFGLCDGLITRIGKAVRFTTFILEQRIEPDLRPYTRHNEWCLFSAGIPCEACIKACPAGAVTAEGHDKEKCFHHLETIQKKFGSLPELDARVEVGCGLCQGAVPCQNGVPGGI